MFRKRRIQFLATVATASLPILLWAFSSGPDPGKTGAPGEDPTSCTASGCHNGPITKDASQITIQFEGGQNYQPGVKQRFTINVTGGRRYGIQVSARTDSGPLATNQAGTFTALSNTMFVLCADGRDRDNIGDRKCSPTAPVEYIEHSTPSTTGQFIFDWTPPAQASAGPVTIYIAANASNGPAPAGANIVQKTLKLTPGAAGGGVKPSVTPNGIVQVGNFGGGTKISAGSYIEIFGKDFTTATKDWSAAFVNNRAPQTLENVQVTVDDIPAFINFVSPGQVNVVVPDGIKDGTIPVLVKNPAGSSETIMMQSARVSPGLLAPASFQQSGKQYVVAQFADGSYAGKPGLVTGATFRAPKPGETIIIYGVGFGPTDPIIPAGTIVSGLNSLTSSYKVQVGAAEATATYRGLSPNFVGLYQFNVVIPNVQAGDQEIYMEVNSVRTQGSVFLTTAN